MIQHETCRVNGHVRCLTCHRTDSHRTPKRRALAGRESTVRRSDLRSAPPSSSSTFTPSAALRSTRRQRPVSAPGSSARPRGRGRSRRSRSSPAVDRRATVLDQMRGYPLAPTTGGGAIAAAMFGADVAAPVEVVVTEIPRAPPGRILLPQRTQAASPDLTTGSRRARSVGDPSHIRARSYSAELVPWPSMTFQSRNRLPRPAPQLPAGQEIPAPPKSRIPRGRAAAVAMVV